MDKRITHTMEATNHGEGEGSGVRIVEKMKEGGRKSDTYRGDDKLTRSTYTQSVRNFFPCSLVQDDFFCDFGRWIS